jgi:hypothetical protein
MSTIPQTSYTPNIAQCDFWLLPKLKLDLKAQHFAITEDIKTNAIENP